MQGRLGIVLAIWFYGLTNYLDRVALSFAAPTIMKEMAFQPSEFGVVLSSFAFGYVVAQIPGGLLADRWGAKFALVISPLLWAVFTAATGLVTSVQVFIVLRVCLGLSEGIALGAVFKIQAENFTSRERPFVQAALLTPIAVAPAIAGPVVGALVSTFSWRAAFLCLVAPTIVASALNFWLLPGPTLGKLQDDQEHTPREPAASATGLSALAILKLPAFWVVAVAWFAYNLGYWGYQGWMPSYLALERRVNIRDAGAMAGLPYAFGFVGLLLLGWLGSRALYRYRPQAISAMYCCAGLALYFAYNSDTLSGSVVALSVAAFFMFGSLGLFHSLVADLAPSGTRGTFWGFVSTSGQLAGVVAPGVIGFLISATGSFAAGFTLMVSGLGLAALLMFLLPPEFRRRASGSPQAPRSNGSKAGSYVESQADRG